MLERTVATVVSAASVLAVLVVTARLAATGTAVIVAGLVAVTVALTAGLMDRMTVASSVLMKEGKMAELLELKTVAKLDNRKAELRVD